MPSSPLPRRVVTLSVVAFVCAATFTAAAAVGTIPTNPASEQQRAADGCFPGVDSVERDEAEGDVVDVVMLLCFEGSVTIEGPGYQGTVNLTSGDKSGGVTLHLNTHLNGSDAINVTSETLEVQSNASGMGSFEPGNYTLVVRDGSGTVSEKVRFELSDPRARNLTLWRAPRGAAANLRTVEAIDASRETATRFDSQRRVEDSNDDYLPVATNETLIVEIEADGLDGAMAAASGSPLDRFRTAVRETGATLQVEQTPRSVPPSRDALTLDVLNSSATHLVSHAANDTYYLVIDTSRLRVGLDEKWTDSLHIGSASNIGFAFRFSMQDGDFETDPPADLVAADYQNVGLSFSFPRVREQPVVLSPHANERILVRTTLAPGSRVTVNVSGGVNRTVTRTVRVRNASIGPTFVVPLNLSATPNGTRFLVRFETGTPVGRFEDTLRGVVRTPKATMQVDDDAVSDLALVVDSVSVTHATVVAVYGDDGTLHGTTAVEAGTTQSLSVPLASTSSEPSAYRVVLFRDADRSGSLTDADERYRVGGMPVAATVATPDDGPNNETATATASRTELSPTTERPTTEASSPGFGVLTTVLAIAGTLLLARRTRQ